MNISINEVTPETVCIHGQTLARPYVEMVLLPLLVASKGKNHGAILPGRPSVQQRRAEPPGLP